MGLESGVQYGRRRGCNSYLTDPMYIQMKSEQFSPSFTIQEILDKCAQDGPGVPLNRIVIDTVLNHDENGKLLSYSFKLNIPDIAAMSRTCLE